MNSFQHARLVEQRGMSALLPFLESRAWRGHVIQIAKGPLARTFQRSFGDLVIATGPGSAASVEVKVQSRWTGNAFLEVWSNKNLNDRGSHIERGSTPGRMITCRADVLALHFLDIDTVHFLPFFRLQQWATSGFASQVAGLPKSPTVQLFLPLRRGDRWFRRDI